MGQEFLVAWGHAAFGGDLPLHVFAVWMMAFVASLAAAGVYGVVYWRTRSPLWAFLAAALFSTLPANYRTIGFILVREDLSLPLFALHLALLARAERVRSARAFLLAGLAVGAACATWHAMGFFVALEVACLHLWFVRGSESPFEVEGAWAVLVGPVLAATLVPALSASGFLFGLPMALAFALLAVGLLRRSGRLTRVAPALGVAVGSFVLLVGLGTLLRPGRSGYTHVFEMLVAKLRFLGVKPVDPGELSFDARLLWQGPFETLPPEHLWAWIGGAGWIATAVLLCSAWCSRRSLAGFDLFWIALTLIALPVAWLIGRTIVLVGLLLPGLLLVVSGRRRERIALAAAALLLAVQLHSMRGMLGRWELPWYGTAEGRRAQIELLEWIEASVAETEPIVSDFVTSTSILAITRNPIVLQPKYETERSRRRAQEFFEALALGDVRDVRGMVRERFGSRYLVLENWLWLEGNTVWTGGIDPTSAATAVEPELWQTFDVVFESSYLDPLAGRRFTVFRVD